MDTNAEMATFDPVDDLSDDDIAAALGYATTLSEPLLPQDEMTTAEDEAVETADESPETEEVADEALEEEPVEEPVEEVSSEETEKDPEKEVMKGEIRELWQEIGRLKGGSKQDEE